MDKSIQNLREQRNDQAVQARKLVDGNPGNKWGDDQQKEFDKITAAIDSLDAEIGRLESVLAMEAANKQRIDKAADKKGVSTDEAEAGLVTANAIFNTWMRGGQNALNSEQREVVAEISRRASIQGALSTGTDSEGGYLVPDGFSSTLLEEMKAFGGMRSVANVVQTASGNTIEWPTVDATSQEGEILAENATVGNQEVSFGIKQIKAHKYSSKDIAVPFELLQDSQIDLEGYIRKLLAERLARITNKHFTVGDGTNKPTGAVTASGMGTTGAAGQTTSLTFDDLINLEHSIDPAYRNSMTARWMFHDSTLKALKKMKDGDSRPLWMPGLTTGEPDTILRYGYTINQHMPEMAANAKSVLFGDFSKYLIRDVMQVMLFRMTDSAFTRKGQVGFLAFSRHDGALIDRSNSSLKHYANSAT